MGSIVTVIALPLISLINKVSKFNKSINGNWINYTKLVAQLLWNGWREKGRLDFHNPNIDEDARAVGLLPIDKEWQFESPNKRKGEDIFLYGINSDGQYLILNLMWRPIDSNGNVKLQINFSVKDSTDTVYTLNEEKEYIHDFTKRLVEYRIAGLGLEILNPFRRLRIKFRGYMKKTNTEELVYARFRLFWISTSNVFDFQRDHNSCFLAKELSRLNSKELFFENRIEQFGQIKGTFQFENEPSKQIYLWGNRCKTFLPEMIETEMSVTRIFGYTKKGIGFHLGLVKNKSQNVYYRYGYCFWRLGSVHSINDISLNANDFYNYLTNIKNKEKFSFTVNASHRQLNFEIDKKIIKTLNGLIRNIKVNGSHGYCLIQQKEEKEFHKRLDIHSFNENKCDALVLHFGEEDAQRVVLSGGKGSSLARLFALSNSSKVYFSVPNGIIVTTNSYKLLLKNDEIKSEVESLQRFVWSKKNDLIKDECYRVSNFIANKELENVIKEEIQNKLCSTFGNDYNKILFAIRSSASGEDSVDMSAAGQMTTFLGVKGLENIFNSVMKCWSSQFQYISVEYKRGFGQLINSPMAVVIQQMVDCDSAGVIFTCDPISGDERNLIITANYGLGESVVSASSEPDSVTLSIKVEDNCLNKPRKVLKIKSKQIGSKKKVIKLNKSGGTTEVVSVESNECCIDDTSLVKLGEIALKIHSHYGNACDIEWGLKNGIIYLLQSRPVTNLDNSFSEYEIMHELDTGMQSEIEINTRAHWGENFAGSMSWLLLSFAMNTWNIMQNRKLVTYDFNPYVNTLGGFFYNQKFMSFKASHMDFVSKRSSGNYFARSMIVGFFGHDIDDKDLWELLQDKKEYKPPASYLGIIKAIYTILPKLLFCAYRLRKTKDTFFRDFDLTRGRDFRNASELFEHICKNYDKLWISKDRHIGCSGFSSVMNGILMSIIGKYNKNDNEVDTDFAILMSCTEAISAEVPNELKRIAQTIEAPENFIQLSDIEALELLKSGANQASDKFKNFLLKHGHRGYKELHFMTQRWADNPITVIKTIKTFLTGGEKSLRIKTEKTYTELLNSIKTRLPSKIKYLLRYLILPMCKSGVGLREESKYFMIWLYNKYQQAFQLLAIKMVAEGRIPDEQSIYFFTIDEIEILFKERDPVLLSKLRQRQRIHPKMDLFKFEELVKGPEIIPRNIEEQYKIPKNSKDVLRMSGTPASFGKVNARVCVAENISDAINIKNGDILITYSTDIGWSPYFPLISGIVTEIGGTISHGAVIAREFGIPSIIAVDGACSAFSTGDYALLDAEKGEIVKLN